MQKNKVYFVAWVHSRGVCLLDIISSDDVLGLYALVLVLTYHAYDCFNVSEAALCLCMKYYYIYVTQLLKSLVNNLGRHLSLAAKV